LSRRWADTQTKKTFSVVALILLAGSAFILALPLARFSASAQTPAEGFQIIAARWGNSSASTEAGPGDENVPLTLTLQYVYPYSAVYAQLNIQLQNGITTASSSMPNTSANNATVYYSSSLQKGQVFQVETFVNLASNISLGRYNFPVTILWDAILSNSSSAPEISLEQNTNFVLIVQGDTKLVFSSAQTALTPGQENNLTLTLVNSGSGNASDIETTISPSNTQQVSVLNQFPSVNKLSPQQSETAHVELFVSSSAAGSSVTLSIATNYLDAYNNQVSKTQTLGLYVTTGNSASQLVIRPEATSLTPGQINNVTLIVTNEGLQTLTGVSTQVSTSSQTVSVLSEPNVIQSLVPGSSSDLQIGLFVSASSSNTAVTLAVAIAYLVQGPNETGSATQNVGFYVSSEASSNNSSLSIVTIENNILTGVPSKTLFNVTNTGTTTIFDPVLTLSVSSPLVIMSNSSYSVPGKGIEPGQSILYEVLISSSPTAAVGVYDGNLVVTYSNQYGISNSQSTQVGFVLSGTIDLIIQDETITQGAGNLTVSGSLLDEGTASAYYASITGSSNSTSAKIGPASYVGEIDPNTPVPFSTTIPFTLRSSSEKLNVELDLTYKNSFGDNLLTSYNTTTTLTAGAVTTASTVGTGASSSDIALVQGALYGLVVIVVIAGVVGAIVVRRKKRQMRSESSPETEEAKVV